MTELYELLEQISYIMAVFGWEDNDGNLELAFNEQVEADERASALSDNIIYNNALTEFECNNFNAVYNTDQRTNQNDAVVNKVDSEINIDMINFGNINFGEVDFSEINFQNTNGLTYSDCTNYAELPTFVSAELLTYTQITNTSAENVDKPIPIYEQMWTIGTATTENYVFENDIVLINKVGLVDSADFISNSALSDKTEYVVNSEITGNVALNSDTVENKPISAYKNAVSIYEKYNAFNTDMMYSAELYNKIVGNAINNNAFEQGFLSNQAIQDLSSVYSCCNYNEYNYDKAYSNNTALVGYSLSDIVENEIDGSQVFTNQSKVLLNTLAGDTASNRSSVNINVDFKAYADVKNDYDTEQFTKVFVNKLKEELTEYAHGIHF